MHTIEPMNRIVKKILYGLLFLAILGTAGWVIYSKYSVSVPTCNDGVLNQGEEDIDCGGPCAACELQELELEIGGVDIVAVGNRLTLVIEVENTSHNYGALNVPYDIEVSSRIGGSLEKIRGSFSIYPGDITYIVEPGIDINPDEVGEVQFALGEFDFILAEELVDYYLDVDTVEVSFTEEEIVVEGELINESGFDVEEVRLVLLLYDDNGELANAGATLLNDLEAFGQKNFGIAVPQNGIFIDIDRTMVLWEVIN